jgi:hypothetical protein
MPDREFGDVQTATGENLISFIENLAQRRLDNPRPCPRAWAGTGEEMLSYDFSFSVHNVLYPGFAEITTNWR